jgi:hypothetical protein
MFADPTGLYQCTYTIASHSMSCTPNDPSHPSFQSDQFVSGYNQSSSCPDCQDNPGRTGVPDHGPLPATDYSIGQQHGLSRRDLTPVDPTRMGGRFAMQLHGCRNPATCSNGCIAAVTNRVRDLLNQLLHLEEGLASDARGRFADGGASAGTMSRSATGRARRLIMVVQVAIAAVGGTGAAEGAPLIITSWGCSDGRIGARRR